MRTFKMAVMSLFLALALVICVGAFTVAVPKVHLDFVVWSYGVDTILDNIEKFEARYPDIEVTLSDFSWEKYKDVMVMRFVGKTPTDVTYGSDHWLQEWAAPGWIVPLEDYFPQALAYKDELAPYTVEGMTYQGKLYGLPYYADMITFMYNEEMLKKAGFAKPPETWDEVVEQALVMKEKGIVEYPIMFQFLDICPWYIEVFLSMVYSYKDYKMFDDKLNPIFDKEGTAAHEVAQWLVDGMQKHKIVNPASLETTEIPLVKAFGAGHVAFVILPKYCLAELQTPGAHPLSGQFRMALMPGETHGTLGFVRFYCMTKTGVDRGKDVIDACWKFIEYFGGKTDGEYKVVKRWALEKGLGFGQLPLYDDPEVVAAINKWGDVKLEKAQAKLARCKEALTPFYGRWSLELQRELNKALLGEKTALDALKAAAKKWREIKR